MKPLLSYAPDIEYEKWSTYEQIKDDTFKPEGRKEVRNYDRQHHGWMSIRDALSKSYNVPAVKTFQEVGSERVHEFRSEEHTSELQSRGHLVCRLLLEKKK